MDQAKIGEFLAVLRKEKGITQEAFAERIGVTNKTVSRWETGKYMPDIEVLLLIADFYNVSVNELLCGERLKDSDIRNKSDSNIKQIVVANKHRFRKVIKIAIIAVICITLVYLATFSAFFIVERYNELYPYHKFGKYEITDEARAKVYKGTIDFTPLSAGSRTFMNEESHCGVCFDLPDEYKRDEREHFSNFFINKSDEYVRFIVDESEKNRDHIPVELAQLLAAQGITKYTETMSFAYGFDLDEVTVFSSSEKINIAAGCRRIRASGIWNEEGEIGLYYRLSAPNYVGYAMNSAPKSNTWFVALENDRYLALLLVKSPLIGKDIESILELVGHMRFIEG